MKPRCDRNRNFRTLALAWSITGLSAAAAPVALAQSPQVLPGLVVTAPSPSITLPPAQPMPVNPPPPAARPSVPPPAAATTRSKRQSRTRRTSGPRVSNAAATTGAGAGSGGGTGIVLVVNGEPITGYDIEQRARLLGLQAGIGQRAQANFKQMVKTKAVTERWKKIVEATIAANQATKTREQIIALIRQKQQAFAKSLQDQAISSAKSSVISGLKSKAREELIEQAVKKQAAKIGNVSIDEARLAGIIKELAGRNKMNPQQFATHFSNLGIDFASFKARFRIQQAWVEVVRKKYGYLVNPNNRDIDRMLQKDGAGEDQLEVKVHRILVPMPARLDQRTMARRVAEAEKLQKQFRNCRSTQVLAAKLDGARFEDLGTRKAASFSEPTRTFIQNAKDNEMIPPSMTGDGIELLAVCERKVVNGTEDKRAAKANELRQEEFDRLSRKHLRDLMADAIIEKR